MQSQGRSSSAAQTTVWWIAVLLYVAFAAGVGVHIADVGRPRTGDSDTVGLVLTVVQTVLDVGHPWVGHYSLLALAVAILLTAVYVTIFKRALFAFLLRRFSLMFVTLIGITIVTFIIIRAAPGDPVTVSTGPGSMGQGIDPNQSARDMEKAQRELLGMAQKYTFSAVARDPDGGNVRLEFEWGDGSAATKSDLAPSGTKIGVEHAFASEGTFRVRCRAIDHQGAKSDWSEHAVIEIREANLPPTRPTRPEGPAVAFLRDEVSFRTRASDPEGKSVTYIFDWGDGQLTSVQGKSGEPVVARFSKWGYTGRYRVRVRAQDERGAFSDWSEETEIVVFSKGEPFVRPYEVGLPSEGKIGVPVEIRVRVPEIQPLEGAKRFGECRVEIQIDQGKGSKREMRRRSAPAKPGGWVSFSHTFSSLARSEKGFRVRLRTIRPKQTRGWESKWWTGYVRISAKNLPPFRPERPAGPAEGRLKTPLWHQYWVWLRNLATLNLGKSSKYQGAVLTVKAKRWWPIHIEFGGVIPPRLVKTVKLSAIALVVMYLVAVPIGIYSSTHRKSLLDNFVTFTLFVMYSLPSFWVATLILTALGHFGGESFLTMTERWPEALDFFKFLKSFSISGLTCSTPETSHPYLGLGESLHFFWHAFLPVVCLTYGALAALSRYSRSGMIEVVRQDYIRTARAKGLSEGVVVYKHALRNGMIPIITLMANILPHLIGGAIIIEWIFSIDGMGLLGFTAVVDRDYPVLMAVATLSAIMVLVGMLISDLLYVLVDPRISFEGMGEG